MPDRSAEIRLPIYGDAETPPDQSRPLADPSLEDLPIFATQRDPHWISERGHEAICFLHLDTTYLTTHGYVNSFEVPDPSRPNTVIIHLRCEVRPGYYPDLTFQMASTDFTLLSRADYDYFYAHRDRFCLWLQLQGVEPSRIPILCEALHGCGRV